jgi:RimJ/RimL family protein N-acetyltransferase
VTSLDPVISTPRLRLELIGPEEAARMLAGHRESSWHPAYPRQDDLDGISMIARIDGDRSWCARHVVRAYDGLVVGTIGFFGPPDRTSDGVLETEVGYGLVEDARGRGVATEAVGGLLEHTDRLGVRVRAGVAPDNTASGRVLAKCGFTELRGSDDEGNLVMARPLHVTS